MSSMAMKPFLPSSISMTSYKMEKPDIKSVINFYYWPLIVMYPAGQQKAIEQGKVSITPHSNERTALKDEKAIALN